ncbi:MAG: hypothetical protein H8E42_11585 [Nitrospinae bacterium]|nr:hypothetical protein [Nitrospinota bacterium]MBL7019973.1 hypothetical protein [Nitrospinaceae bacterium]
MNPINIQKMAIAFGLLAFGFLAIGSVLMGSRVITGVIRGGLGAVIFGGLVWGFANLFLQEDEDASIQDVNTDDNDPDKGNQLDQTA